MKQGRSVSSSVVVPDRALSVRSHRPAARGDHSSSWMGLIVKLVIGGPDQIPVWTPYGPAVGTGVGRISSTRWKSTSPKSLVVMFSVLSVQVYAPTEDLG